MIQVVKYYAGMKKKGAALYVLMREDHLEEEGWAWSRGEASQLPKASVSNYKAERRRACHRVTWSVRGVGMASGEAP